MWASLAATFTVTPDRIGFWKRTHGPWLPGLRMRAEAGLAAATGSLGVTAIRWDIHNGEWGNLELSGRVARRWWLGSDPDRTCAGPEFGLSVFFVRLAFGALRCPVIGGKPEWLPSVSASLQLFGAVW